MTVSRKEHLWDKEMYRMRRKMSLPHTAKKKGWLAWLR